MATYDFVSPPPHEYCCLVTKEVLLDPYLTLCCGVHLSKQVAEAYNAENRPCPGCKEPTFSTVLDKFVQKKVLDLKLRCPNTSKGCSWQGSVAEQDEHLNGCQFATTACPYKCNAQLTRSTVKSHAENDCPQRPTTCKYCSHRGSFASLAKEHNTVCPGYPVTCPNGCGKDRIERQLLPQHIAECPMAVVKCDFSWAGCATKAPKMRMQQHVDSNVGGHLSLVASKQAEMLSEIETLKKMFHGNDSTDGPSRTENALLEITSRLDRLEQQWSESIEEQSQLVASLQTALSEHSEIIGNMEKKMHDQEKQQEAIASLQHQIAELQKICAQKRDSAVTEQPKGKKVPDPSEQPTGRKVSPDPAPSEHDSQPKVTKYERRTSAPIQQPPRVTPPLPPSQPTPEAKHTGNDQDNGQLAKGSSEPEKAIAPEQGIRAKLMMYENKSQAAEKQNHSSRNPTAQPISEKLDPPKGAAAPKPQQQASLPAKVKPSQIAPVDLIMTDFAERKENDDFWFSDPFYTHQSGYKLCLKVIPGGLGVGASKHVSVSVYVMKGEFDDSLKWPFKGDITLQLLDWAKEEVRSEKVISFHEKVDLDVSGRVRKEGRAEYGWGNPEFVSHAELASGRAKKIEYLRNDSLKFRVSKIVIYSK